MSDDPYAPPSAALQEAPGAGLKVGELLRHGLRIYLGAFPVVLLVGLLSAGLGQLIQQAVGSPDPANPDLLKTVLSAGSGVLLGSFLGPIGIGAYAKVGHKLMGGQPADPMGSITYAIGRYPRILLVNLAYMVATTLGMMACFLPGIALTVLMGPMLMSAALSAPGLSDWKAGWAVGSENFVVLGAAMLVAFIPMGLISGLLGGAGGFMAVSGQTLPQWLSLLGGLLAALTAPYLTTTLAAAWLLANPEP